MNWTQDLVALGITVAYVAGILVLSELVRSGRPRSGATSQRVMNVGLALGSLLALTAFEHRWLAVMPFLFLLGLMVFCLRCGLLHPVSRSGRVAFRSVWLLVSLILLPVLFWEYAWRFAAAAGILGAALAEALFPIGERLRSRLTWFWTAGTWWESGLTFTGVFLMAAFFSLWGALLEPREALWYAAVVGLLAALLARWISPTLFYLVVPGAVALTLWWLVMAGVPVFMVERLLLGVIGSFFLGILAWQRGALSQQGVGGAVAIGTLVFTFGGWRWAVLLLAFFCSASALTAWRRERKKEVEPELVSQGQRGFGQAMANGAWGGFLAVAGYLGLLPKTVAYLGFAGAMAAANADTWGTEVGVLSAFPPRLITTGREVKPGTSGAVSLLGLVAALAGALFIGLVAWVLELVPWGEGSGLSGKAWILLPTALVGGLLGSLLDSWVGALWQGVFYCTHCHRETEKAVHSCGQKTHLIRGLRWVNNEVVNFAATVGGSLIGLAVWFFFRA